jgi:hypothetical protein
MTTRGNGIAVKGPVVGRAVAVARLVCEVLIGERPTPPVRDLRRTSTVSPGSCQGTRA